MPTLSMFYGIIIRMQSEKHIHCLYGDDEIVMSLDGEVLEGSIPANKLKLIVAWISLHEDELRANWKLLSEGEGYFKIEPLR